MSDKDSPHAASGYDNAKNVVPGETSTEDEPSPLVYGRKTTNPSKVKTSRKHRPVRVKPLDLQWVTHLQIIRPQVKQKVRHLILLMCEYMNSLFKAHQP